MGVGPIDGCLEAFIITATEAVNAFLAGDITAVQLTATLTTAVTELVACLTTGV
ncbi:MAG TPA: hypothetical protein VEY70_10580 [Metabacillus sp.]|nr:hypothetical protein [Metabacillus sp.]